MVRKNEFFLVFLFFCIRNGQHFKRFDLNDNREGEFSYLFNLPKTISWAPWKKVYRDSYIVNRNWKTGRYSVQSMRDARHAENLCIGFDESRAASISNGRHGKLWDIKTGDVILTLDSHHSGLITTVKFNHKYAVSGSVDSTIKIFDLSTKKCVSTLIGHEGEIVVVQHDTNGTIVSGSEDKTVRVWKLKKLNEIKLEWEVLAVLEGHTGAVTCLQFEKSIIVSGSVDSTIKVWEIGDNTEESLKVTLDIIDGPVYCLQFNNRYIISGGESGVISIWDWQQFLQKKKRKIRKVQCLVGHSSTVVCLQFDSCKIVSGSADKSIKIWDFYGSCLFTLTEHSGPRWRDLASQNQHVHPNEKIVFVKKNSSFNKKSFSKDKFCREEPERRSTPKEKKEKLTKILKDLEKKQKVNITDLLKNGYLNLDKSKDKLICKTKKTIEFNPKLLNDDVDHVGTGNCSPINDPILSMEKMLQKLKNRKEVNNDFSFQAGLHEMIEEFDPLKRELKDRKVPDTDTNNKVLESFERNKDFLHKKKKQHDSRFNFVPQLNLCSKREKYNSLKRIEDRLINKPFNKSQDNENLAKLEELHIFLASELESLTKYQKEKFGNNNQHGIENQKLHIYSTVFDQIIQEFSTYGPILSEIKKEYDKALKNNTDSETELNYLRKKVQNLIAENENRVVLKFERKKNELLSRQLEGLKKESIFLKADYKRKLGMFSSYLPASVLIDAVAKDPELSNLETTEDPISLLESKIKLLEIKLAEKNEAFDNLKRLQEEDSVPKALKDQLEFALQDATGKLAIMGQANDYLSKQLDEKSDKLRKLEVDFQEKEEQYAYLIAEYNQLSEKLAGLNAL
ncbi:hypothetical protein HDU92_005035 [Lobulomyces angularis]|nr:hypothetical protein HDU92_005035 [Lobulomyces angularis]